MTGSFFGISQVAYQCKTVATFCLGGVQLICTEILAQFLSVTDSALRIFPVGSQIEITPIYTNIIAFLSQYFLVTASGFQEYEVIVCKAFSNRRLYRHIYRPLRTGFEIQFHIMRLSVIGSHFIRDIVYRTTQQIQVIHEKRSSESQIEVHRSASKLIKSLHRLHIGRYLLGSLLETTLSFFFVRESEIKQRTTNTIVTVSSDQVLTRFQCSQCLCRKFG